jgi:diaminohydroxyphosphoribosylaminopyrimidine deaminase/5-amino-6-(5-phosphoribosylamino)uracil reductase
MSSAVFSSTDHQYMAQALRLAERGLYTTMPNPRVGCVIVKDGIVIGEGWTQPAGQNHAEIQALNSCTTDPRGATVYVSLEPCSHYGRTPPCAEALVAAGVARVIAAMRDPNPKVSGAGLALLQAQGIAVECGLMETQARELNMGFVSRMARGRPWVRTKTAASLDGATALENGVSQWITGEPARQDVQHWRARSCAILTGIGTVLADDPQMNVRAIDVVRQPLRVIVDSRLQLPSDAKILQGGNVLVACRDDNTPHGARLCDAGAALLALPDEHGQVDLSALLVELAKREINEVQIEAGATLNGALLQAGLVDELLLYYAPTLLGRRARGLFDFPALTSMQQRMELEILSLDRVGQDIRLIARPKKLP